MFLPRPHIPALSAARRALWVTAIALLCLFSTPTPMQAVECDNLGEPVIQRAGLVDDFAPPTDPTSRRPELDTAFGEPTFWGDFDTSAINTWIGHTFQDIPADLCRAELVLHLRPLGDGTTVQNDSIQAGSATSDEGFFADRIEDFPEANGTWQQSSNGPTVFTLDLSTLQFDNGMTVFDVLQRDRVLDVRVQDDTEVDYFELRLWSVPWTTRYCGQPDDFELPLDNTYRGPELNSALSTVIWKRGDDTRNNRAVGCTFANLPDTIFEAELEVRLKPGTEITDNDNLSYGLRSGSPLFAFSSRIHALPEAGGSWNSGDPPATFTFDVTDIIQDGRLDLYIQDDTVFDYARLRYRTCPPPVPCFGWTCWTPDDLDSIGPQIVLPADTSISFDLEGADGTCVDVGETCPRGDEDITTSATFQRGSESLDASVTFSGDTVTADFPEGLDIYVDVEVFDGSRQVTEFIAATDGLMATLPPGTCVSEIDVTPYGSDPRTYCFEVYLTAPTEIDVAQGGPQNVTGDRIRICPPLIVPVIDPFRLATVEVTNNGLDELVIEPSTLIVGEDAYLARGPVRLEGANGSLRVTEIPAEGGGFDLVTSSRQGPAQTFLLDLAVGALDGSGEAPEGSALTVTARGSFDDVPDQPLGRLHLTRVGDGSDVELATDFSDIESPTQTVQVFQDGLLVAEEVLPAGVAAQLPAWPDRIGKLDTSTECYVVVFEDDRTITLFEAAPDAPNSDGIARPNVEKVDVVGDEVRLLASDGASDRIDDKTALSVIAEGGIEELTVIDAHVGRACEPSDTVLCLNDGRFAYETTWRSPNIGSGSGTGQAVQLTNDTGYFWFFQESNVELVVKALDACSIERFWVFAGGLTNVEVEMTVTDTWSGEVQVYENPLETPFQPLQDTNAFRTCDALDVSSNVPSTGPAPLGEDSILLNDDRFRIEVEWRRPNGVTGIGHGVPLTDDTGYFWFFDEANVELVIKVLDACAGPGRFWVFAGGLTNVEARVTVTDTQTGEVVEYLNPLESPFQPIQDTSAFDTCP